MQHYAVMSNNQRVSTTEFKIQLLFTIQRLLRLIEFCELIQRRIELRQLAILYLDDGSGMGASLQRMIVPLKKQFQHVITCFNCHEKLGNT